MNETSHSHLCKIIGICLQNNSDVYSCFPRSIPLDALSIDYYHTTLQAIYMRSRIWKFINHLPTNYYYGLVAFFSEFIADSFPVHPAKFHPSHLQSNSFFIQFVYFYRNFYTRPSNAFAMDTPKVIVSFSWEKDLVLPKSSKISPPSALKRHSLVAVLWLRD